MSAHEKVETNIGLMLVLVILVISIGFMVQVIPQSAVPANITPVKGLKPYSALQLTGRDIYIREGCSVCHTQMIRPFRSETERYGHYSVAGEFVYDRPFLWGSKRTGPDLHRIGTRGISNEWHYRHLHNPRDVVPTSIMPAYPWLAKNKLTGESISKKMRVLKSLGHPYTEKQIVNAPKKLIGKTEADAVVAYLQGLGTAIKSRR